MVKAKSQEKNEAITQKSQTIQLVIGIGLSSYSEEEIKNMSELKGICPNCGARYYGWALTNSLQQKCARCDSDLEITETGIRIRSHYSSLTTRTYKTIYPTHMRRNNG